jgi:hypothetical protein
MLGKASGHLGEASGERVRAKEVAYATRHAMAGLGHTQETGS